MSDLPYNVPIKNNVSGNGRTRHDDFVMATGKMSPEEFTAFLVSAVTALQPHLVQGALLYLYQDWRHLSELLGAAASCDLAYLNLLVWAKDNAGQGALYRSAHELIGVFRHGNAPHRNNIMLGKNGRNRTNVLHYPGMTSFGRGRTRSLELHPTVKPVAMIADLGSGPFTTA
ncbi:hypothetical protein [Sphingomonas sp. ID0503]|uniref:hypothetical protein n=1 Tax=Sphingomonas sp. ID0503 TaxID=3399691 RepID=UPI003AFB11B0